MRVVSFLPSATEMLYTLGVEPVGVSHECDHPPAVEGLPTVNSSPIDPDGSTAEINQQVADAQANGGVYEIDRQTLADLDPDVIVSQGICEVCAVDDGRIRDAVADLGLDAEVVTTDPHSLEDVFDDLERLGRRLGRESQAEQAVADLRARVRAVERTTPTPEDGPDVAVFDWLDPVMVAGHWMPGLIERAGGRCELAPHGAPSRPREWDAIRAHDPDVIVAAPCGLDLDRTLADAGDLASRPGWETLTAVQTGRVYAMDGHDYANSPGPRLVDTIELLAGIITPGRDELPASAVKQWPGLATNQPAD
jgi:iron complex transport system substrate-binding protein